VCLNYESLTVPELQQRVQACLDRAPKQSDAWLEVVSWFQESMRPAGVKTSRATLDALNTRRPIIVRSSFGHTVLASTRALELASITAATPDPAGGKIWRDAHGEPTGLLEDTAFAVFSTLLPKPTLQEYVAGARAALTAMNRQGVTSFLDAWAAEADMDAFQAVRGSGKLTARAHFAPPIEPSEANDPERALKRVVLFAHYYDEGVLERDPGITVRNAKLFLDGVIAAPALTGAMRQPYFANSGTAAEPDWAPGPILVGLARAGI